MFLLELSHFGQAKICSKELSRTQAAFEFIGVSMKKGIL